MTTNFQDMYDLSDHQKMLVNQAVEANKKDKLIVGLLWFFLCPLAGQRFYLGNTGYAILMILFGWATLFIWPLVDIFFALKAVDKHNAVIRAQAINELRIMSGGHDKMRAFMRNEDKDEEVVE